MSRKLDMSRYGGMAGTKLTVDDLEADATVVTISEFGEERNPDGFSPLIKFREIPDKKLYLNRTQLEYIVRRLGDDTDQWVGKRIPLEKKEVPFESERFAKVYVMPPDMWDAAFKQWDSYKQQQQGASQSEATQTTRRTSARTSR